MLDHHMHALHLVTTHYHASRRGVAEGLTGAQRPGSPSPSMGSTSKAAAGQSPHPRMAQSLQRHDPTRYGVAHC